MSAKEKRKNKTGMSSPLPSQIAIKKDLKLIFDILTEQSTVAPGDILGEKRECENTRSKHQTLLKNSLQNKSNHCKHLSLLYRYKTLLMEIETNPLHKLNGIQQLNGLGRERAIEQFIDSRNCFENEIRKSIYRGTYVYKRN